MRNVESRAPHELAVDHARGHVAINLLALPLAPVFQDPLDIDPRSVGHVHGEEVAAALAGNNRRRQGPTPLALLGQLHRMVDVSHRGRFVEGKAEGAENLEKGWGADAHPVPVPVPKAGCDAVSIGDTAQLVDIVGCGGMNIHGSSSLRCGLEMFKF